MTIERQILALRELLQNIHLCPGGNPSEIKKRNDLYQENAIVEAFDALWHNVPFSQKQYTQCLKITNNVSLLIHFVKRCKNETFCWIFKQYEKSLLRSIFNLKIKMFTYGYAD